MPAHSIATNGVNSSSLFETLRMRRRRRTSVEKPVIARTSARAPKCAQNRRDIHAGANAVADHGNVRQPRDQFRPGNLPIPVGKIIRMKPRLWLGYTLQEIRTDHWNRLLHEQRPGLSLSTLIQPIHRREQYDGIQDRRVESAGSHSPIGSRFHHALSPNRRKLDNDKAARGCNGAARRETDCWRGARACRDRCAEVSRRNAASTDIRPVTPWPRTRFASRSAVDTAR